MHHLYSPREFEVEKLLQEPLSAFGYRIVRVKWISASQKQLEILIERMDGNPITLKDCSEVSKYVSTKLDVEDIFSDNEHYHLDISSPGIDRPLMIIQDFERYIGNKIMLKTRIPHEHRKRFKGIIQSTEDATVTLFLEEEDLHVSIPLKDMQSASLMLSETL